MRRVAFYYDLVCPWAYLAHTQIAPLAARHGAALAWCPVLLGGIFRAIGAADDPNALMPASKAAHARRDLARWAEHLGVPLVVRADHPRRSLLALLAVLATGEIERATRAVYAAAFGRGEDLADARVIAAALDEAGLDGEAALACAETPDVKGELRRRTEEAVATGAFGVPSFVVVVRGRPPELFFGQDRLTFVEEELRRS